MKNNRKYSYNKSPNHFQTEYILDDICAYDAAIKCSRHLADCSLVSCVL